MKGLELRLRRLEERRQVIAHRYVMILWYECDGETRATAVARKEHELGRKLDPATDITLFVVFVD